MDKIPMTQFGADAMRTELNTLKNEKRPAVIAAIAEARAHGDLKENAEYHAAREQQGFIEGRIRDLEAKLSLAHIIDVTQLKNEGKVIFGATVTLINCDNNTTLRYQIVGDDEADIKQLKISVNSPIARALVGKFAGDATIVHTPNGEVEYEISAVDYI